MRGIRSGNFKAVMRELAKCRLVLIGVDVVLLTTLFSTSTT